MSTNKSDQLNPRVGVITVVLNGRETIATTLDSFLKQDYDNRELLVIDGGSTDGTLEIVEGYAGKYPNITVISGADSGIYDAMNIGWQKSSGVYVGYLNSGDVFLSDKILSTVAKCQQFDVVSGGVSFEGRDGSVARIWIPKKFNCLTLRIGWSVPHPGLYIKKSLLDGRLPFTLKYKFAGDYDLICRLALRNLRWFFCAQPFVHMSYGGATTGGFKSFFSNMFDLARVRFYHFGLFGCIFGVVGNYILKINSLLFRR
jgi:glycosyltransferase involved in cell wall biosynthesis